MSKNTRKQEQDEIKDFQVLNTVFVFKFKHI